MSESSQSKLEARIARFVDDVHSRDVDHFIKWFHPDARITNHGTLLIPPFIFAVKTRF